MDEAAANPADDAAAATRSPRPHGRAGAAPAGDGTTPGDAAPGDTAPADAAPDPQVTNGAALRAQAARRRALDSLFGDVLPDITADETDRGDRGGRSDRWYSENRPPHHD